MGTHFLSHLQQEQACLVAVIEILEQEEQLLQNGLFSDLTPVTERKSLLLDRLAQLDRERDAWILAQGHAPGRAGADAAASAEGPATQQAWSELLSLAEKAKACNRRCAALVYTHLDFTQKAIDFLHGSNSQSLYGSDGGRQSLGGGNRLAAG